IRDFHVTGVQTCALPISAAGRTVTFRSGGTSLSGQGVTDSVLLDVRKYFRTIEILDDGTRVRVGPGMTVRAVNSALARHGYRLRSEERRVGKRPAGRRQA